VAARQVTLVDPLPTTLDLNTLSLEAIDSSGWCTDSSSGISSSHDVDLGHDNRSSALPSR
jgi:hypothetical protein